MATDLTSEIETAAVPIASVNDWDDEETADSFEQFRTWIHSDQFPKNGVISFIQGVLEAELGPESIFEHNIVKTCVMACLYQLCEELDLGQTFSGRLLYVRPDVQLITEPDVTYCSWASLQTGRVQFLAAGGGIAKPGREIEMHGTPDIVVEIVSPSSVTKDKKRLKKAYYEAGIPEYWLIDARQPRLDFKLLVRGPQEYSAAPEDQDGYRFSTVMNRSFLLQRLPNPVGGVRLRMLSR